MHTGLAWFISRARDWGFDKVYLHTQLLHEGYEVVPHAPPSLSEGEKQNFLKQRQKEALLLAEFAEEQGVEILDPFGEYELFPSEVFSSYKNLLPKLREKFSGELGVGWVLGGRFYKESGCRLPGYVSHSDYTGFDYVTPRFWLARITDG